MLKFTVFDAALQLVVLNFGAYNAIAV